MTSNTTDTTRPTIAKLTWVDPTDGTSYHHVLTEGATASIGRASNNDIFILERHVSRQHAVITFRNGVFMISDLGSVNGTFVNKQRIDAPFPLFAGDEICLYVPTIQFEAASDGDVTEAESSGFISSSALYTGKGRLVIANGAQEGQEVPLLMDEMTVGRATVKATWEIALQDQTVSRPHATLRRDGHTWCVFDLGSANGTRVNDTPVTDDTGYPLSDGDRIAFGHSMVLFRAE